MMIGDIICFCLGVIFAGWQPALIADLRVKLMKLCRQPCEHDQVKKDAGNRFKDHD